MPLQMIRVLEQLTYTHCSTKYQLTIDRRAQPHGSKPWTAFFLCFGCVTNPLYSIISGIRLSWMIVTRDSLGFLWGSIYNHSLVAPAAFTRGRVGFQGTSHGTRGLVILHRTVSLTQDQVIQPWLAIVHPTPWPCLAPTTTTADGRNWVESVEPVHPPITLIILWTILISWHGQLPPDYIRVSWRYVWFTCLASLGLWGRNKEWKGKDNKKLKERERDKDRDKRSERLETRNRTETKGHCS